MQCRYLFDPIRPKLGQLIAIAASSVFIGVGCQTANQSGNQSADEPATTAPKQTPASTKRTELPQSDLVLWLRPDADYLEANGGKVVAWKDASARGNDLVAPGQTMQPTLVERSGQTPAAVRFDGQDDMLLSEGFSPSQIAAATVFIVAAPAQSSGQFDGLISAGNRGAEDSFTGFNIDLGGKSFKDCADTYPDPTTALNTVNVQSAKTTLDCGQDLLEGSVPFERRTLLTVRIDNDETSLRLDGEPQQSGAGGPDTLTMPQLRLGVRFQRQKFQGYYDGAISEVVVYGRSLSDDEVEQVETTLARWHGMPAP